MNKFFEDIEGNFHDITIIKHIVKTEIMSSTDIEGTNHNTAKIKYEAFLKYYKIDDVEIAEDTYNAIKSHEDFIETSEGYLINKNNIRHIINKSSKTKFIVMVDGNEYKIPVKTYNTLVMNNLIKFY